MSKTTDKFFENIKSLALKSQIGDKESYNQLLTNLYPYIKNFLKPQISDMDQIDDITQEVLISIHKSLHTFSPDRPFKPWLYSIINFRKIDYLRKHYSSRSNVTSNIEDLHDEKKYVTNNPHAGEYKDIEKALSILSDKQRQIYTRVKIEGYTAKEVAKERDMTESAVKVSVHRAGEKLREVLK